MEERTTKKKEWIKNAAIIFLVIMLLLTFFSNTIMNYSLPEVVTAYVQSGTISAKVRGTGNVEATDPYNIIVKETRTIASVAVKQGDEVEKDAVIYYLEDKESDELTKARDELEDLELAYMKGLFGGTISSEVISKVANGNTDTFASYQAKVTDMQNRLDAAEARVKECQDAVTKITLNSTLNTNNSTINTIPQENEKDQATTNLTNAQTAETDAQTAFNNYKQELIAEKNNDINEVKKSISDCETVIKNAESVISSSQIVASPSPAVTSSGLDKLRDDKKATANTLSTAGDTLLKEARACPDFRKNIGDSGEKKLTDDLAGAIMWMSNDKYKDDTKSSKVINAYQDYLVAKAQDDAAGALLDAATSDLTAYSSNKTYLTKLNEELVSLTNELNNLNAMTYTPGDSVEQAQNKLNQATVNLNDKTNSNKQSSVAYQNQLASAQTALTNAQAVLDLLKQEQTELSTDINAELDLSKATKDIEEKEAEIAKLEAESTGATVISPVAGTVMSIAHVAGETTAVDETVAVIQVAGKSCTVRFSVTNEQAKKVQIGDTAELQNSWYYDDAQAILAAIKPDTEDPGQKKLLVFNITGASIQVGQSLSLSVGQRSADYELVVPNSAVREDNNGKFILTVESKSSPFGNRYMATRVDVEVLAKDDNNTAISAPLYGYEYVITTSTKPVEAGKQVRLTNQ